jgi:rhamnulokinase
MPERIRRYCKDTKQAVPQTRGEIVRVALESIALKYRWVLERLEEIAAKQFAPVHIIGGGTKNLLLNQFTSNATNRTVIAGPVEATAIGNALMQAIGIQHLDSLADARAIVRTSFEVEEYHPLNRDGWDEAYERLLGLI